MNNLEKLTPGLDHLDQTCIVCSQVITAESEVVACPRCRSVHHVDCWKGKGGCGKTGCPQVAKVILGEKPAGDGPPPPVSKKVIFGGLAAFLALILLSIFWPKPPDPAMGRTKIVVLGEAYYDLTQEMTDLADSFNETSEDIYIDLQLLPPGSVDQKLVVLIAAGDAPDVISLPEDRLWYFLENEAVLALGEDENGEEIYAIQNPGQLAKFIIWGQTPFPEESLKILNYFADHITPVDLDLLRNTDLTPIPIFGY